MTLKRFSRGAVFALFVLAFNVLVALFAMAQPDAELLAPPSSLANLRLCGALWILGHAVAFILLAISGADRPKAEPKP